MTTHKTAAKWRNLIDGYRLLYDVSRLALTNIAAQSGAKSPGEAVAWWEDMSRAVAPGGRGCRLPGPTIRPDESLVDGFCRIVRENLGKPVSPMTRADIGGMPMPSPIVAPIEIDYDRCTAKINEIGEKLEATKQAVLAAPSVVQAENIALSMADLSEENRRWAPTAIVWEDTMACAEWSSVIGAFLSETLLLSDRTRLFVLDADLMRDVIASRNDPIQGDDLGLLPFPQMWVEFDETVEFARGFTRPLNVQAAGLWAVGNSPLRLIYLLSDVPCKTGGVKSGASRDGQRLLECNAALYLLFWGNQRILGTADRELAEHLGFEPDAGHPHWQCVLDQAQTSAKNLYDFLTCRSFDYVTKERDAKDYTKIKKYQHLQGGLAKGARHYRMVKVNQEILKHEDLPGGERTEAPFSVAVPGCFHRWVYCKSCSDTHRHDLIGSPCRKCGLTVGPSANITVHKYWHPPHTRGQGPQKEYVRNLVD